MKRNALLRLSLVLASALLLYPAPLRGETKTEQELAELAKSIKKWLAGQDESMISLEPFSSADSIPANGGPGLYVGLRLELERAGVKVKSEAKFIVTGKYRGAIHKATKRKMLLLQVKLVDREGRPQLDLNRGIFGEQAILSAVAPTVALPPDADEADREDAIAKRIDKPDAHLADTKVSASKDSPYGVEVLVEKDGRYEALTPRLDKGLPSVSLKRDDVFAVRLTNGGSGEAAVTLLIDGLHVFSFNKQKDKAGRPILMPFLAPAGKSIVIKGWPTSLTKSDKFLVTSYSKSAVAELKADRAKLGVITAQFAAAWPKGDKPPSDEGRGSRSELGAGRGPTIDTAFKSVERTFGVCRAQVSIRYAR
jgi:hypothetical protein